MQIIVEADGTLRCVYAETLSLASFGTPVIKRASHVEPEADEWFADLSPVAGPRLGPFEQRSAALAAEAAWLDANWLI